MKIASESNNNNNIISCGAGDKPDFFKFVAMEKAAFG